MATASTSSSKRATRGKNVAADVSNSSTQSQSDPAVRYTMIAEAAYYRAERRGFAPGHELDDWLLSEAEVDGRSLEKAASTAEIH